MNVRWLSYGLLFCVSCSPAQSRAPGHYVDHIKEGDIDREYILRVPKGYQPGKAAPVVFALHGLWGNMNAFALGTGIEDLADKEGFICVIPNGTPTSGRGWNTGFLELAGTPKDVQFIGDILDKVEKEFTTDKKRTFVFGHSNGAMMSYYLGGVMSDRFAAVAGVAGTVGIPGAQGAVKCVPDPKYPVSVLMIHGMKDPMVAFKPGDRALLQCTGAVDGAKWWAKVDGCKDVATIADLRKNYATLTSYTGGKNGTEVRLITTMNGTHDIPGALTNGGRETASGVDAISEIWSFFKSHPRL